MKQQLQDLSALVSVRNHIMTVLNDANATERKDYQPLNKKRMQIDKMFVDIIKETNVESLISTIPSIETANTNNIVLNKPKKEEKQLSLPGVDAEGSQAKKKTDDLPKKPTENKKEVHDTVGIMDGTETLEEDDEFKKRLAEEKSSLKKTKKTTKKTAKKAKKYES